MVLWKKTPVALLFIYGIALYYLTLGLPGVPFITNTVLLGWDDFAEKIDEKVAEIAEVTGRVPIVVGMDKYRLASGLTFYRKKDGYTEMKRDLPTTTGRHLFHHGALMYSYWHPQALFINQDLLVISHKKSWLPPAFFQKNADVVGKIHSISIEKQGKIVSTYYYRMLSRYQTTNQNRITYTTNEDSQDVTLVEK